MFEDRSTLPEDIAVLPPGPELTVLLASIDRSTLDSDDLVRLARARHRLVAHQQAELLADLHAVAQLPYEGPRPPGRDDPPWSNVWAEVECAFAMRWTGRAASGQVTLAWELVERLPAVLDALRAGRIDVPKVLVIRDAVFGLEPAVARRVVDQVIDAAEEWTTGQLRARLRRLVIAADPGNAAERAVRKLACRRVEPRLNDNNLADLLAFDLPPQRVAAAMERLTAIAAAAKAAGDTRRVDHLRADAMLDLLVGEGVAVGAPITHGTIDAVPFVPGAAAESPDRTAPSPSPGVHQGGPDGATGSRAPAPPGAGSELASPAAQPALPAPRRGVIELHVPLTTLLGLTEAPGELAGFGPVIADVARQVAAQQADATWRFSVSNDLGEVIHHGVTRRRPTAAAAAFVRARNRTCVAPGCRRAASGCDLDHTTAWSDGGHSGETNLGPLCRRHHRFKHAAGSDLIHFSGGVFGWTTPAGLQYVTRPEPAGGPRSPSGP
jgi:hypothetical protein